MRKILVRRIERIVDLERTACLRQVAGHGYVATEVGGINPRKVRFQASISNDPVPTFERTPTASNGEYSGPPAGSTSSSRIDCIAAVVIAGAWSTIDDYGSGIGTASRRQRMTSHLSVTDSHYRTRCVAIQCERKR